jgi:hypothetical protein
MLVALGGLCYLAAFICGIIILIAAFKDEIWKGIVGLLCGLYLLYYGIVEFDHPQKWTIVGVWLGAGIVGAVLMAMGGNSMAGGVVAPAPGIR